MNIKGTPTVKGWLMEPLALAAMVVSVQGTVVVAGAGGALLEDPDDPPPLVTQTAVVELMQVIE